MHAGKLSQWGNVCEGKKLVEKLTKYVGVLHEAIHSLRKGFLQIKLSGY